MDGTNRSPNVSDLEEKRQELTECQEAVDRAEKSELRRLSTAARREWKGKCLKVRPQDIAGEVSRTCYSLVLIRDIEAVGFTDEDEAAYYAKILSVDVRHREGKDDDGIDLDLDEDPEWAVDFLKDQFVPTRSFLSDDFGLDKDNLYAGAEIITREQFQDGVREVLRNLIAPTFATSKEVV